jgi:hypothetical protein
MLKKDVLYTYPLEALRLLTDSESFEIFHDALTSDEQKADFRLVTDSLRSHKDSLLEAKVSAFPDISSILEENIELLSGLEGVDLNKLILFCSVAGSLVNKIEELKNDELDEGIFKGVPISSSLCILGPYFYQNLSSIEKSIFYVDFSSSDISESISSNDEATELLLFHLLDSLKNIDEPFEGRYVFVSNDEDICKERATSTLKLHLLLSGEYFHERVVVDTKPCDSIKDVIDPLNAYHQFNDALVILSEYNSREELLNKYLSIYHALENFMYRLPIVQLSKDNNGKMFSIRNFKDLYSAVADNEIISIKKFFSKVMSDDYLGGNLCAKFHAEFCGLIDKGMTKNEVDQVLVKFGVRSKSKFYTFDHIAALSGAQLSKDFSDIFSTIVYSIRNAVVHNKETEFHLSHSSLNSATILFISELIIPSLEDTVFTLISDKNEYVWYSHENIKLYA